MMEWLRDHRGRKIALLERPPESVKLIRISARHFVAGAELSGGKVVRCAPIVKYMKDWTLSDVERYANEHGWKVEAVD